MYGCQLKTPSPPLNGLRVSTTARPSTVLSPANIAQACAPSKISPFFAECFGFTFGKRSAWSISVVWFFSAFIVITSLLFEMRSIPWVRPRLRTATHQITLLMSSEPVKIPRCPYPQGKEDRASPERPSNRAQAKPAPAASGTPHNIAR